jgi:hypothetical protein
MAFPVELVKCADHPDQNGALHLIFVIITGFVRF